MFCPFLTKPCECKVLKSENVVFKTGYKEIKEKHCLAGGRLFLGYNNLE